ncbi:protein kinase family protein [Priestia koreensis]|uniref:protein kinase family protein n=1 Tax=Priestia koreensis TaxID=284581 RepID=UPI001F578B83|nr:protein kinase family protein [Priestia koreensis]UNL87571.1 protein kinase family protein [Priestia koreensis]
MDINNFLSFQEKELKIYESEEYTTLYSDLYSEITHVKLQKIFINLHGKLNSLISSMNEKLPNGNQNSYYIATDSRELIKIIENIEEIQKRLSSSDCSFSIDEYYEKAFNEWKELLQPMGTTIPSHTPKFELYYEKPIFKTNDTLQVSPLNNHVNVTLKLIGEGSYAQVYRYKDPYYSKSFVLKRAKKNLDAKEIDRFQEEFKQMKKLNSPYVVEVYNYDALRMEYTMESMDCTLEDYISKNNNKLKFDERVKICKQILKAFAYIHSKNCLHRDISPKNILIKQYDDVIVAKVADFGLAKTPLSTRTSYNTEMKGYMNDPALQMDGFKYYDTVHETYALTRLFLFVLTGKYNLSDIKDAQLIEFGKRGMNPIKEKRFKNVGELSRFIHSMSKEPVNS